MITPTSDQLRQQADLHQRQAKTAKPGKASVHYYIADVLNDEADAIEAQEVTNAE